MSDHKENQSGGVAGAAILRGGPHDSERLETASAYVDVPTELDFGEVGAAGAPHLPGYLPPVVLHVARYWRTGETEGAARVYRFAEPGTS